MPARRGRQRLRGAAGLFAVCFARSALSGIGTDDESWFLQVLDRVSRGEVLYRDVFFGVTPLAVQALAPAVRLVGSEVLILRAAVAASTTATALISSRAARQLGVRDPEVRALLALAVVAYGEPVNPAAAAYAPLARLAQMASLEATVGYQNDTASRRRAACAGAAAGVSFASKQSTGLSTAAAMAVCLQPWRRRHRVEAGAAGMAFAASALAPLVPVVARGAGRRFIEYAFVNKRRYLRAGRIPYVDGLRPLHQPRGASLRARFASTKFLVPPLAGLSLAAAAFRHPERAAVLGAFTLAALSDAFPRSDEPHISSTIAPALLAIAWGTSSVAPSPLQPSSRGVQRPSRLASGRLGRLLLWAWLGSGVAAGFAPPFDRLRANRARISRIPHFRGIVEDERVIGQLQEKAIGLRSSAGGGATFILATDAARYYLLTGIRNPTPYDYPYATAFGVHGERRTSEAIRRGQVTSVLLDMPDGSLSPRGLIETVRETMTPVAELGGTLYRQDFRAS